MLTPSPLPKAAAKMKYEPTTATIKQTRMRGLPGDLRSLSVVSLPIWAAVCPLIDQGKVGFPSGCVARSCQLVLQCSGAAKPFPQSIELALCCGPAVPEMASDALNCLP